MAEMDLIDWKEGDQDVFSEDNRTIATADDIDNLELEAWNDDHQDHPSMSDLSSDPVTDADIFDDAVEDMPTPDEEEATRDFEIEMPDDDVVSEIDGGRLASDEEDTELEGEDLSEIEAMDEVDEDFSTGSKSDRLSGGDLLLDDEDSGIQHDVIDPVIGDEGWEIWEATFGHEHDAVDQEVENGTEDDLDDDLETREQNLGNCVEDIPQRPPSNNSIYQQQAENHNQRSFGPHVDVIQHPSSSASHSCVFQFVDREKGGMSEGDSLEEIVQQQHAVYLQEKMKRENELARLQRSRSAPACATSLASPNASAQRKRNEQEHPHLQPPEMMRTRVEYKPRDSAAHVPILHDYHSFKDISSKLSVTSSVEDRSRDGKGNGSTDVSEEIDMDTECRPWEDTSIAECIPRLQHLGSGKKPRMDVLHQMKDLMKRSTKKKKSRSDIEKPKALPKSTIVKKCERKSDTRASSSRNRPRTSTASVRKQRDSASPYIHHQLQLTSRRRETAKPLPRKKGWNFDTTISEDKQCKKRPMSAIEINRKVRNLIRQTQLASQVTHPILKY